MPQTPKSVLLIEDDGEVRRAAQLALESVGLRVLAADGVQVGFHLFQTEKPELVVLDINLPDGDGVELCRRIRGHKSLSATPVIMLTGKGQLDDKQAGFEAGADQYLVKPVLPRELVMWVQALLQRVRYDLGEGGELAAGDLIIDPKAHLVRFRETTVSNLTGKEFDLLYYVVKRRPQVITRKQVLSNLWKTVAIDNVVDTHMSNLRRKLPRELADRLQAVPGKGFRYFE